MFLRKYISIGVAVDTPNGLLVPVVLDVDKKTLTELAIEITQLAEKARLRKLTLDDMQGRNFTLTNLGASCEQTSPHYQPSEVAILVVSRSRIEPVFTNGAVVPRTMLPLALSYDHRVIDGADAARFLRWLSEALEQPWVLFLEQNR
jgi:pyruvate dehydrogenase E2 component (dihydrolipoamide acetyltransferase)